MLVGAGDTASTGQHDCACALGSQPRGGGEAEGTEPTCNQVGGVGPDVGDRPRWLDRWRRLVEIQHNPAQVGGPGHLVEGLRYLRDRKGPGGQQVVLSSSDLGEYFAEYL